MQSGLSRELFEAWCQDPRNAVIIADFAVQGTLAREVLAAPEFVMTRGGARVRFPHAAHSHADRTVSDLDEIAGSEPVAAAQTSPTRSPSRHLIQE